MSYLLENISIKLGDFSIQDLSLDISKSSFTSIVGPSGCGKTTLLRILAGLEKPSGGRVIFSGTDITDEPAEKRSVGFVFQQDAMFPHMTVLENVSFGPRMRKMENSSGLARDAMKICHVERLEDRGVLALSGGEKKRVQIARAISYSPDLLLLDEPFNGLDANLKEKMKIFLSELREKTKTTIVMVTHDIDDAFSISDNVVVMSRGKIEQFSAPEEIFKKPSGDFVREFVSHYLLANARAASSGKNAMIRGSFEIPSAKKSGKAFVAIKKNSFRFEK